MQTKNKCVYRDLLFEQHDWHKIASQAIYFRTLLAN